MKPLTLTLAAILTFAAPSAFAADADDLIKYRKNVMKAVGGSTQAIAAVLKGEAGRKEDLPALTAILAAASDPALVNAAFQPNTDGQGVEKTTSTADIWGKWDDFTAISTKLGEATKAAAAKGADLSFADMKPVFAQCKACHDGFRQK
ncbi:MAG: cytochrome c [Pseudomonadota bacterium]